MNKRILCLHHLEKKMTSNKKTLNIVFRPTTKITFSFLTFSPRVAKICGWAPLQCSKNWRISAMNNLSKNLFLKKLIFIFLLHRKDHFWDSPFEEINFKKNLVFILSRKQLSRMLKSLP